MKVNYQTIKPRGRQCPRTGVWSVYFGDMNVEHMCMSLDKALIHAHATRDAMLAGKIDRSGRPLSSEAAVLRGGQQ
ncbi:hypothetical protein [Burkholderia ubonensis]|uniref:Uncharacterized protein n=1 Tax=Burkholderia ubonensis TaxID=101571 RepID=A0ABD4E0Y6_9BURK|nr:hypothetical protein [Burkholderia ubonensis]KVN83457.1 hypothetical protein WJ68_16225 [Burkholderia ubonensis]